MLARRLEALVLAAACSSLLAVGCSSTVHDTPGGAGAGAASGTSSSSTSSGSTTTAGSGGGDSGAPFDAGAPVTTYETSIGPLPIMPGDEYVNCIVVPLDNDEGGFVRRFRADLSPGTHHMIVYKSNETTPQPTPTPCQSFAGLLEGETPLFIAQQPTAELVFPSDATGTPVGFQVDPHQMLRLELHYINTTSSPLEVTGKASMDTIPLTTSVVQSSIAFWGTDKILIPPDGSFDTGTLFQIGIPGTKTFALTTHQHHLGTQMRVWYATGPTDDQQAPVADSMSWSNPPLVIFDPPLNFPSSGDMGFAYDCHWVNPTSSEVTFGEGFNNEMCFLWHYYFPSQGFQLCIDGQCNM
jgi:hypothetical protein